jgi:hypothetical protein
MTLSLGEQSSHPPNRSLWAWLILLICALVAYAFFSRHSAIVEHRLYFTEDRRPVAFAFADLSEAWTEQTLRERFAGHSVSCHPYTGELAVDRACAVYPKSHNDVPVLFISFFFAKQRLDQVSVNIPWWSYRAAVLSLDSSLGRPSAVQSQAISEVRLYGWRLANGAAVFFNRDRSSNPLIWNAIYWRSASACQKSACFRRYEPYTAQ